MSASVVFVCLFQIFLATSSMITSSGAEPNCPELRLPTRGLREAVIRNCEWFQSTVNPALFCRDSPRNCTAIWEAFYNPTRHQPMCNVSLDTYQEFVRLTNHSTPPDHSLFYENTYPFVSRFSFLGYKMTTISDTLTGYIADGLVWCSDPDTPDGLAASNFSCPGFEPVPDCPVSAEFAFWSAASKNFGHNAVGNVFIMLNASVEPIYDSQSYLATYEVPNYRPGYVTIATVLLINEDPKRLGSRCVDQSLANLSTNLAARGIKYECVENRRDVITLLCHDQPQLPVCSAVTSGGTIFFSGRLGVIATTVVMVLMVHVYFV